MVLIVCGVCNKAPAAIYTQSFIGYEGPTCRTCGDALYLLGLAQSQSQAQASSSNESTRSNVELEKQGDDK